MHALCVVNWILLLSESWTCCTGRRDAKFCTASSPVDFVPQLHAGVDRLAAVVLCVMALFDLPVGSHCTAAVPPRLPPPSTLTEFNICKAWIRSLPLFSKRKSSFHLT